MAQPHLLLDLSDRRRAFACGDIHGEFGLLEDALAAAGFDPALDALVSVGDLTDRGGDSMAALDWIARPWFHRALGNHCIMPRLALQRQIERSDFRDWGGGWVLDRGNEEMERIAALLEDAPTVITVLTPGGRRVGIAHADCGGDWDEHVAGVEDPKSRTWRTGLTLWSRETIKEVRRQIAEGDLDPEAARVVGVDHVFHGHTIMDEPLTVANRSWIDTGAYKNGTITLVDMDDWITTKGEDA